MFRHHNYVERIHRSIFDVATINARVYSMIEPMKNTKNGPQLLQSRVLTILQPSFKELHWRCSSGHSALLLTQDKLHRIETIDRLPNEYKSNCIMHKTGSPNSDNKIMASNHMVMQSLVFDPDQCTADGEFRSRYERLVSSPKFEGL